MARKEKTEEVEIFDVKDEKELQDEMNDFLKEMGVEANWNEEDDDGLNIPADFNRIELKNMEDGEVFEGKPHLSGIRTFTFTDRETGEEKINNTISLVLLDADAEEAYIYPINLKTDDLVQTDIKSASKLYSLVMGLMECKQKGVSQSYNELPKVNLESLGKMIEKYELMEVECKRIYGNFDWNNFRITDVS